MSSPNTVSKPATFGPANAAGDIHVLLRRHVRLCHSLVLLQVEKSWLCIILHKPVSAQTTGLLWLHGLDSAMSNMLRRPNAALSSA